MIKSTNDCHYNVDDDCEDWNDDDEINDDDDDDNDDNNNNSNNNSMFRIIVEN